jgi:anti-sigma regulatory factor (Ser/Thr protein kinase)
MPDKVTQAYDGFPEDPKKARHFVASVLEDWGVPNLTANAELIVSELVTNAILHGHSCCVVSIKRDLDHVRIEVEDESGESPPVQHDLELTAPTGRGLILVDALSSSWGWEPSPVGKVVWANISQEVASFGLKMEA